MPTSEAVTLGIRVQVHSLYVPERSRPASSEWYFVYHVKISNESPRTAQLLSRHWVITDANGSIQEVRGPGVVGRQPILGPGESHEYTSSCPLRTSFGTMHGSYQMVWEGGDSFEVEIAPFALGDPQTIN